MRGRGKFGAGKKVDRMDERGLSSKDDFVF